MSFLEPCYDLDSPDEYADAPGCEIPHQAKILPGALVAAFATAWLAHLLWSDGDFLQRFAMIDWAVSASALAEGRYETILLHMFAHGGTIHLVMNSAALLALGPPMVARLGEPPHAWFRFLALFILSGLAGAAMFLAIHLHGTVPMLGASGAICGVVGLLARFERASGELVPIRSAQTWETMKSFLKENALLFLLLTVPALLAGRSGGVAWETHLGGLLFGLLAGPLFLPKRQALLQEG